MVQPKRANNNSEADTDDMLTALRRQLQPHLVMALQGHTTMNYPGMQVSFRSLESTSPQLTACLSSRHGTSQSCQNRSPRAAPPSRWNRTKTASPTCLWTSSPRRWRRRRRTSADSGRRPLPKYLLSLEYSDYLNRTVSTNDTKCDIFSYSVFCIVPSWKVASRLVA